MKFSNGNAKLGENCLVVSRPVGDTCPSSCEFLGHGCYAEFTEKLFKVSRTSSMVNLVTESGKIRSMLMYAHSQGKSVRLHERGDFFLNGKLDVVYLANWVKALESLKPEQRPKMWAYTHIHDKRLLILGELGVNLYASVSTKRQLNKAKKVGFKLFAWADIQQNISKRKKNKPHSHLPSYVSLAGEKFLVCPEQRKGRTKVTCTGTCETVKCGYCTGQNGQTGNVVFLMH